jgi:CheY-like chemotaxis protein
VVTKTILVADDSKTIQTVVSLTFRATDFKVVSVSDGQEALRRAAELRPDVVLIDVAMPLKNGYELCKELKSGTSTSSIPVLLLAGAFEPYDERRAQDARADGFIKKPFDSQTLLDRVNNLTGARLGSDMPMSFAASLAARQKTESSPSMNFGARAQPSPAFAQPIAQQPVAQAPVQQAKPASSPFAAPISQSVAQPVQHPPSYQPPHMPPPLMPSASRGIAADLGVPATPVSQAPSMSWGASVPASKPISAPAARPLSSPALSFDEPEVLEDEDVVEDEEDEELRAARALPSLEPPRPPNAADTAARANVDVWALAEEADEEDTQARMPPKSRSEPQVAAYRAETNDIEAIEEVELDEPTTLPVAQTIANAAAQPIANAAAASVPGMSNEELVRVAREVIERIAWEVVPELAETIIRAELSRLLSDQK